MAEPTKEFTVRREDYSSVSFPKFRKPVEIGSFSQDIDGVYHGDDSEKMELHCPSQKVKFDLNQGFNSWRLDDKVGLLNDMLIFIVKNRERFAVENTVSSNLHTDFVCWRGLLSRLVCTVFERRENWKISAIKFNGTIYLCEYDTEEKIFQNKHGTLQQKRMTYWGHKFETYVTKYPGGKLPDGSTPVHQRRGFCQVVRTRLEDHSLVYGGETDGYCPNRKQYIELKTSRIFSSRKQYENFLRYKCLKWWVQSFLLSIPIIICGFRDDDGIVSELKEYQVAHLPQLAQEVDYTWNGGSGFNFLNEFLTFLKEVVSEETPRKVYVLTWEPQRPVKVTIENTESPYNFLPDWFIEELSD